MVKNPPAMQDMWVRSLGQEDPLEKEMTTHSSILAWEIPWTEEPGELQSMELLKSRTRLSYSATATIIDIKIVCNVYILMSLVSTQRAVIASPHLGWMRVPSADAWSLLLSQH